MQEYAVGLKPVYFAGLAAGRAAAVVMGRAYPDLYGAIAWIPDSPAEQPRIVPAITFHGNKDTTWLKSGQRSKRAILSPSRLYRFPVLPKNGTF